MKRVHLSFLIVCMTMTRTVGGAFNTRAMERQLEILKEMGNNAFRTSHNPPAPA